MVLKRVAMVSIHCLTGVFLLAALTNCSVGMALSGKKTPDLGAIRVGSTRGEVELQLGAPVKSITTDDKKRIDVYEYEVGNDPSAGRAIGHGVLDVLTLGLWEVVGTPIEGFMGNNYTMTVTYDTSDRVVAINRSTASQKAEAEAKEEKKDIQPNQANSYQQKEPGSQARSEPARSPATTKPDEAQPRMLVGLGGEQNPPASFSQIPPAGQPALRPASLQSTEAAGSNKAKAMEAFETGLQLSKTGNHKGAIESYDKAIRLNPLVAAFYINRGISYLNLGNNKEAIENFTIAIELNPQNAEAFVHRGNAYGKAGDYKNAINDMKVAAKFGNKEAQDFLKPLGIAWE